MTTNNTTTIDNRIIEELILRQNYRNNDKEVKRWLYKTINDNPIMKCLANISSEMINYSNNQIDKQICEQLKTRLNLNDTIEAVYWLDQVIGEDNSVVDFLANRITAMIDTPLNVRIPKVDNAIRFDTVHALYTDMVNGYQSFIKSENEANDNTDKSTIEGMTIYRVVELVEDRQLHFVANKFGGSELLITGNIQKAEKIDNLDSYMSEYRIHIENRETPLVLMACKR